MMLRRLSILGSLLLAACVPVQGPGGLVPARNYTRIPGTAEIAAWQAARRADTAAAYRVFMLS